MKNDPATSTDLSAVLMGGGIGFLSGAAFGAGIAWLAGQLTGAIGGFVVLHAAFAMMLMGAWTGPCFLPDDVHDDGTDI